MRYKWKTWLLLDLIAGLIVGTMQIPQSFAYAQLVGIQPIYGLYLAFFPVMVYYFFGSSRHISIGTIAIVSLLSGSFLEQSLIDFPLNTTKTVGNVSASVQNEAIKASRVAGLTLFVGISQLIMGVFNLGFLTKYLSDPLISGFTVGSAIIVFSTQLKYCFGVTIAKYYGIFSVWNTLIAVCKQLPNTNIPTFVLTAISIILLAVTKNVINPILMKKIHFPIPIELLVVVAGTVSSQYLDLHNKYNVSVVGTIIQGVPAPVIPVIDNMSNYISNIIVTAIIAFSVSISLGKMFAKKHGYKIDATQEFIAFGLMNIFSSFFYCYPSAGSVSRSAVQEAAGGKTQITSLVSVILILFVLLFIGPLFQPLPNCILASVIIVALKSMLMKFVELKELWLFSIWDFSVWMVTFLFTIFLDVQYGLIAGVALSIISIVLRTQSPNSHILGQISGTDLYKNVAVYGDCHEIPGIKIFRYEGSIYYACKDHFKKIALYKDFLRSDNGQVKNPKNTKEN
uniref:Slc26a-4 n=1 Tax=Schmidtea mediterranea TaxID=79327 RepID=A0A0H3YKD1_SCHMD|nr:slc26a-4 [Schmidtea mediterranea]